MPAGRSVQILRWPQRLTHQATSIWQVDGLFRIHSSCAPAHMGSAKKEQKHERTIARSQNSRATESKDLQLCR